MSSSTILLKDVADITGSDLPLVQRLQYVKLAPAPAPGRRVRLDFDDIRARLEATGLPTGDINYSGSTVIIVASLQTDDSLARPKRKRGRKKAMVAPAQQQRAVQVLTDSVRRVIQTKYQQAGSRFVEVVVAPEDVPSVFAGAADGFEFGPINPRVTQPQNVEVHYQDAEGQTVAFHIQCVVSERPQVPVLNRSISTGEVIHESDLTWQAVDNAEGLLRRFEQIVDKEAKKGIHAGEPIHSDAVRSVPLVRSNDIVTGVWKSGGIRITGQFKSRNDGALGDIVTLVKLTGSDQMLARVTDVHEAEILDPDRAPRNSAADDGSNSPDGPAPIGLAHYSSIPPTSRAAEPLSRTQLTPEIAGER